MIQLREFNPVDYLDSEEVIAAYLELSKDAGEQAYANALENVALARERINKGDSHGFETRKTPGRFDQAAKKSDKNG